MFCCPQINWWSNFKQPATKSAGEHVPSAGSVKKFYYYYLIGKGTPWNLLVSEVHCLIGFSSGSWCKKNCSMIKSALNCCWELQGSKVGLICLVRLKTTIYVYVATYGKCLTITLKGFASILHAWRTCWNPLRGNILFLSKQQQNFSFCYWSFQCDSVGPEGT